MILKNRLSDSTSPYLQQHANNPVAWQPWDDAALKAAKESDKPILVSIGYSACHWCHVMEHESFEDPQIAEIMNEAFVCIKVDREERPDVDQVYMEAVQALGINGGWPLNVFLTSEQKPFYGGTYFPKETWARVLKGISNAYRENREQIEEDSNKVTEHLSRQAFSTTEKIIESKDISGMAETLSQKFDHEWGGIDKAPKFPMPSIWMFLLKWSKISGEKQYLDFVHKTMLKMTNGGIFDLVRGGFARYSVDRFWKVPHFEKMLYDNGQLLSLLAVTVKETQDLQLRSALKKTCEWIRDEMTDKDGGFYSAYDADSEGEEGKYYIWSIDEIETILEDDAPLFKEYFDISFEGNWEHGNNILFSRVNSEAFAKSKNISHANFLLYLDSCYSKLKSQQEKRTPPGLDHKKIASWNALCIMGLLDAYYILEDGWILDLALKNAEYLKRVHLEGSKLFRIVDESQKIQGFHDDYAAVCSAFISVYEYTLDESWLDYADKLAHYVIENFAEEGQSHFFYTDKTGSQLVARKKELFDNVIPASNSIMAHALHRLGALKTDTQLMHRAKQMTEGMAEVMISNPDYLTHWASMAINIVTPTIEIAVTGPDYLMNAFRINQEFNVNTVTAGSGDDSNLLLLQNRISDSNSIFVCENGVCHLPSKDTEAALAQIKSIRNI